MIYTKEDILLESEFCGDMVSIYRSTDMILDSIMESVDTITDVDMFMESGSDVFKGIITQIKAIFQRIKEFAKAQIQKVKEFKEAQKYKAIMTPAAKAQILRIKEGEKIPCPNMKDILTYCSDYEKVCEEYFSYVDDELQKLYSDPKYDVQKIVDAGEKAVDDASEIAKKIRSALADKHDMTVKDVYEMLEYGFKSTEEIYTYVDNMDSKAKKLTSVIEKVAKAAESDAFKEYVESCEDYYTIEDDTICYEAGKIKAGLGKIRSGLSNVVHKIDKMVTDHAKTITSVLAAISVICGVLSAGTVGTSALKHKEATKKNDDRADYDQKYYKNLRDDEHRSLNNNNLYQKKQYKMASNPSANPSDENRERVENAHKKIKKEYDRTMDTLNKAHAHRQDEIDKKYAKDKKAAIPTAALSAVAGVGAAALSRKK